MKAATSHDYRLRPATAISIHAAREGGDAPRFFLPAALTGISIHAAREGGDEYIPQRFPVLRISIHAAREGGDPSCRILNSAATYFNPRRP